MHIICIKTVHCNKIVTWILLNPTDFFLVYISMESFTLRFLLKTVVVQQSNLLKKVCFKMSFSCDVNSHQGKLCEVRQNKRMNSFSCTGFISSSSLFHFGCFFFTFLHMLWNFILSFLSLSLFYQFLSFLFVHCWYFTLAILHGGILFI